MKRIRIWAALGLLVAGFGLIILATKLDMDQELAELLDEKGDEWL